MTLKRIAIDRRWAPAACAVLAAFGAALPAHAQVTIGPSLTGGGLYDFLIQTNCIYLQEQTDTRTPFWAFSGPYPDGRVPLFGPGTARGYVRTIDLADQITWESSQPTIIPPPPKIQAVGAIGGVKYQQTEVFFTIKTPSRITDVDITAVGSVDSVTGAAVKLGQPTRVTRKFRVYPPQKISKVTLSPTKQFYADGDRLRIEVELAGKIPYSTTKLYVRQPQYKNTNGGTNNQQLPEWQGANNLGEKAIDVPENATKVAFEFVARFPSSARVEQASPMYQRTSLTIPVQLKSASSSCPELVTNPTTEEVRYDMVRPLNADFGAKPASSLPVPVQPAVPNTSIPAPRDPLPTRPDPQPDPSGKSPGPAPRIR